MIHTTRPNVHRPAPQASRRSAYVVTIGGANFRVWGTGPTERTRRNAAYQAALALARIQHGAGYSALPTAIIPNNPTLKF